MFLGQSCLGLSTLVDPRFDPVFATLLGCEQDGEASRQEDSNHAVSALAIDLSTRRRVKLSGTKVASSTEGPTAGKENSVRQVQLILKVETSLGGSSLYSCRLL